MDNTASSSKSPSTRVFISHRHKNGSEMASLLSERFSKNKKWFVFLDRDKLKSGRFDEALIKHVKESEHFILVLTPGALDRCITDKERDWVYKEIVTALENDLNIIPVIHPDFEWPPDEALPEKIRNISRFNGVPWSHYYQNAVIDVLERFIKGAETKQDDNEHDEIIRQVMRHHRMHDRMMKRLSSSHLHDSMMTLQSMRMEMEMMYSR